MKINPILMKIKQNVGRFMFQKKIFEFRDFIILCVSHNKVFLAFLLRILFDNYATFREIRDHVKFKICRKCSNKEENSFRAVTQRNLFQSLAIWHIGK